MKTVEQALRRGRFRALREPLSGAYFWLVVFMVIYCARPEDWIPGLHYIPIAKISGVLAFLALLFSLGRSKRRLLDLPREVVYLILLIGQLFVSALISPVWRGGAFYNTLDFAKAFAAIVVILLAVTNISRLRRLIFIQTASVVAVAAVSIVKGYSRPRLRGVLNGIYDNPNDLAFAIVLMLPFCCAFLLKTRNAVYKAAWTAAILVMIAALMLTASRAGFVALIITGAVALYHFAVKGRRLYLIVATGLIMAALIIYAGGQLQRRFAATSGEDLETNVDTSAYGSFQQRQILMERSWRGMLQHPWFGIGTHNFISYSGVWKEVHNSYLQIGVEGGFPALVLYLLIFWQAFANVRRLNRLPDLDEETRLYIGAFHSTLIGFLVGAAFSPEAYHYFPYFTVSYTWVLLAVTEERIKAEAQAPLKPAQSDGHRGYLRRRKPQWAAVVR